MKEEDISEELKYLPYLVLPNLDYESQLEAIKDQLSNHQEIENIVSKDIGKITDYLKTYTQAHSGEYYHYLQDERGEKIHSSIYQSAAHSMAAIGMLAPFIESLFHQAFLGIKEVFYAERDPKTQHLRWENTDTNVWDCHYFVCPNKKLRKTGLVNGIIQLSKAVGLLEHLPENVELMLTVLFSYRNKMFHCGIEWPLKERKKFADRIENENWPVNWFNFATSGNEPWVFYLSNEFIMHCIEETNSIINGIAVFIKNEIELIENINNKE